MLDVGCWMLESGGVADEGDEHALDDEFAGGDQVGVVGIFRPQEGFAAIQQVAFEGGFAIDEGGDDIAFAGFTLFQNDGVAIADVGIDHGIAAHPQGKGAAGTANAEGSDVDGDAALAQGFDVLGAARGDAAVDGDIDDLGAVEFIGEDDRTGLAGESLNDALALDGAEVAHGGGLAGEAEVMLDFAGGRHDPGGVLGHAEVIDDFLLAVGQLALHSIVNSVPANKTQNQRRCK